MSAESVGTRLERGAWPPGAVLYLAVAGALLAEAAAFLAGSPHSLVQGLEQVVGFLCHHDAARTLTFAERALPVCARCTGIWAGWLLALPSWRAAAAFARRRPAGARRMLWLIVAAACGATALAVAEALGWMITENAARALLGLPMGLCAGGALLVVSAPDNTKG